MKNLIRLLLSVALAVTLNAANPTPGGNVGVALDSTGTNVAFLNLDSSGNLMVTSAGGGGGGTSSSFGSAFPTTGTALGVSNGTNMVALLLGQTTMSASLPVAIASNQGSFGIYQTDLVGTGSITTQNLNPSSGAPTAGSTVSISSLSGIDTVSIQVSGTYTGALTVQGTVDGTNWVAAPTVLNFGTNAITSTIGSAAVGIWQVGVEGFNSVRVSANAAVTGTAVVTLRATAADADVSATANLAAVGGVNLSFGQAVAASSIPVVQSSDTIQDQSVTGQSAQTATVNNILTTTSGTAATSMAGYRSVSVQINSTGTGGGYIFEGSNDDSNFVTIPVYNQLVLTGTPIVAAITPTATNIVYAFPVTTQYIRCRISTAITGGSIQAIARYSQSSWGPPVNQVAQATAANLNATVTATNLSSNMAQVAGTTTVTAGVAGLQAVGGNIAVGMAPTEDPVLMGGITLSTVPAAAIANGLTIRPGFTGDQQLIVHQDGDPSNEWFATSGTTPLASTSSTALKAAGGAGIRNYCTGIQIVNNSATGGTVSVLDGSTVIWTLYLPPTGATATGAYTTDNVEFRTPLKGTAATAMNIQLSSASMAVYYNVQGYQNN